MKICKFCGIQGDISLFVKDRMKCRECHKQYCKDRRANNEDLRLKENKDMLWRRRLREYGVTKEEFYSIFEKQGGKCAICLVSITHKGSIDHCHNKNKVRGILCTNCNTSLGQFKDNIEFLKSAIVYLQKSH
jgi:hypothetical protein